MSEQETPPREFQPIDDPGEANKLLWESAKTFASAMIWSKDQYHVINTHITVYSKEDKLIYAWVPKDLDPAKFMDEMARLGQNECYFSVSLSRANIFFKAPFQGYDDGGFKFGVPSKVFKVQRRKDLRLTVPDGHVLKVSFQDPLFQENVVTKKAIDISAGGLAVLVDDHEGALYPAGTVLKGLSFAILGKKILCEAEVRHVQPLAGNTRLKGVKLGLIFRNIRQSDVQTIASYVFEESRKFFSRFI